MADKYSELRAQLKARLEALRKRLAELEQKQQAGAPAHVGERTPCIAGGVEDRQ